MLIKALELTGRFQKALGLTWATLMQAIVQIAEKVAIKMDVLKLNQEILWIEKQLDAAYGELGKTFYQLPGGSLTQPLMDEHIAFLMARIQQLSSNRKSLGRSLVDLQDETFLDPLIEFLRMFKRAGGTIEPVTIPTAFPSSEKKVKELGLPSNTLVIGLQRKDQVIIPCGNTSVRPGDRLFLLASVRDVEGIQKIFQDRLPKAGKVSTRFGDKL